MNTGKCANSTHIAASRQTLSENVLTVLTIAASRQTLHVYKGKKCVNSTHMAASRHILQRHEQTMLTLLHQDKLCRKMSKQYIAASRQILPENELTILALLYQDRPYMFYREMSKQCSHSCIMLKTVEMNKHYWHRCVMLDSTDKGANSTHIAASRQNLQRIDWRILTAPIQTLQIIDQTVYSQWCIKTKSTEN